MRNPQDAILCPCSHHVTRLYTDTFLHDAKFLRLYPPCSTLSYAVASRLGHMVTRDSAKISSNVPSKRVAKPNAPDISGSGARACPCTCHSG